MIVRRDWWPEGRTVSVVAAVSDTLDGGDYGSGAVESAGRTADNTADAIGRLVDLLHDKGLLSDEDVLRFLQGGWETVR